MAAPIVGENSIGIRFAWRSFQAAISRSASSRTRASVARRLAASFSAASRRWSSILRRLKPIGESSSNMSVSQSASIRGKSDERQGAYYLADRWRCRRLACWHGCQRWRLWADWQHHRRHCRWTDRRLAFTAYRRCNRRWRDRSDHQRFYRRGYFVGHSETDQTIRRRIAANIAKLRELLRRRASDTPGLFIFAARETSHLSQKNKISSGGCVKRPQKLRTDQHGRAAPRRQRWIY